MLLQVNMSTSAMVLKDAHRIMLKDIKASGSHRSMPVLPTAFIDGSLLSVDFLSAVTSAAVTVRNSATGEIVYSSVEMNVTTLRLDNSFNESVALNDFGITENGNTTYSISLSTDAKFSKNNRFYPSRLY